MVRVTDHVTVNMMADILPPASDAIHLVLLGRVRLLLLLVLQAINILPY
jgi:hypothetical protein